MDETSRAGITPGLANAMQKGRLSEFACTGCGFGFPVYTGRYPAACPRCSGTVERREAKRRRPVAEADVLDPRKVQMDQLRQRQKDLTKQKADISLRIATIAAATKPTKGAAAETSRASMEDQLPGGRADDAAPSEFDPAALAAGTAHEMEHTNDPEIAREIAMDHLREDPEYYVKLAKIEKPDEARTGTVAKALDLWRAGKFESVCCLGCVGGGACTRAAARDEAEVVCTSAVPRIKALIDAGTASMLPHGGDPFCSRTRTLPVSEVAKMPGGLAGLRAFFEERDGRFFRMEGPTEPVLVLEGDLDAMRVFATRSPSAYIGFDPRAEMVDRDIAEGALGWRDILAYARAIVSNLDLDDEGASGRALMLKRAFMAAAVDREAPHTVAVCAAKLADRLDADGATGPSASDLRDLVVQLGFHPDRVTEAAAAPTGKSVLAARPGAGDGAQRAHGGFRFEIGKNQKPEVRTDVARSLQNTRNSRRGVASRVKAAKEWHRSAEGQSFHKDLGRYNQGNHRGGTDEAALGKAEMQALRNVAAAGRRGFYYDTVNDPAVQNPAMTALFRAGLITAAPNAPGGRMVVLTPAGVRALSEGQTHEAEDDPPYVDAAREMFISLINQAILKPRWRGDNVPAMTAEVLPRGSGHHGSVGVMLDGRFANMEYAFSKYGAGQVLHPQGMAHPAVDRAVKAALSAANKIIKQKLVTESATSVMLAEDYGPNSSGYTRATANGYTERTVDDVFQGLLRKLVVIESLDILQDVEFTDEGGIYLMFDPSLPRREVEDIVQVLREGNDKLALAGAPDGTLGENADWWVVFLPGPNEGMGTPTPVQQNPLADPNAVPGANEPPKQQMVVPAKTALGNIAASLDLDAALKEM